MKKMLLAGGAVAALILISAFSALAIDNQTCLDCHADETLVRQQSQGSRNELAVDARAFKNSVHNINGIGCTDCHADITALDDSKDVPHAIALNDVSCESCHEDIGAEYGKSVHANASRKGMIIRCYACHGYHDVRSQAGKSVLERENNSCLKCHNPYRFHNWLPQKDGHFAAVQCTVCHAPDAPRHLHLRMFDLVRQSYFEPGEVLAALETDMKGFLPMFDQDGNGILNADEFDRMAFVLRRRNLHATFRGELLSEHEPTIHQVRRGKAERGCEDCHSPQSPLFEDVALFFGNSDGTNSHIKVERQALESYAVNSFHLPGGTRIRELDLIGIVLVAGAVLGVAGHASLRLITRPMRQRLENEQKAGQKKGNGQAA